MQIQGYRKKSCDELLKAIDDCVSIGQVCALVQHEHIVIQMKSQQSASSLPQKPLPKNPNISPLDSLKAQVKAAVLDEKRKKGKEDLIKQIQSCNTIVQIFQLVQKNDIVIQMKSQQSASCLPQKPLPKNPNISPLDSLKKQVIEAVLHNN